MSPSDGSRLPADAQGEASVVMVADHEILVRMVIARYLRECGFRVIEAASAAEALVVLEAGTQVDVSLIEAQLPGEMDGFALSRWIRSRMPHVWIVLASSTTRKAQAAGDLCDEGPLLEKPYDAAEVERRIKGLLSGRRPSPPADADGGVEACAAGGLSGALTLAEGRQSLRTTTSAP